MHDPRARPGVARADPDERSIRAAAGCARGGHRRRSCRRPAADRDRGHGRDDLVDLGRSGRRHRRHRRSRGLWLHVDAAYAGAVAIDPGLRAPFAGWERADSIVVNPHKWLWTPVDASLLLSRRLDVVRDAFSLVPEYLRTVGGAGIERNYNEYTPQLGRRMRALKLWIQLRWFGLDGLRRRIRRHLELAEAFAAWVDAEPGWERLAPVPFSTVCFRHVPAALAERRRGRSTPTTPRSWPRSTGPARCSCSHTKLRGRFTIRLAIGSLRTERRHVERAWELLRIAAEEVEPR